MIENLNSISFIESYFVSQVKSSTNGTKTSRATVTVVVGESSVKPHPATKALDDPPGKAASQ